MLAQRQVEKKKVFLICAEKSGNNIIGDVVKEIQNKLGEQNFKKIEFEGIVYDDIAKKYNIRQLFSPSRLAVFGVGDIIFKIPELLDSINYTANSIIKSKPDVVLSVDAYDFCFRVARKVRQYSKKSKDEKIKNIKMFHIVAPSVWAYLPKRAKKVAKYFNHLFYLLPFEKKYFKPLERYENKQHNIYEFLTTFVGFPATFQTKNKDIQKDEKAICITVGSRSGEIRRHKDLVLNTIMRLKMVDKNLKFYILATKETSATITAMFGQLKNTFIVDDEKDKRKIIQKCILALVKSGTNNIEIGALGTPMIVFYKTSPITYWLGKMFATTKLINIYNISLNKMAIPEIIQHKASPENLANLARQFLSNPMLRQKQLDDINLAIKTMQTNDKKYPLDIIAEKISCFLKS